MRLATWNLNSLALLTPDREAAFRQAMDEVRADVWVLTETWVGWPPVEGYTLVAASCVAVDLIPWPTRRWVSIWVRPGLNAAPLWVRSQPDRMACVKIGLPAGNSLVVVGTVLPWMADPFWPGALGYSAALIQQAAEWNGLWGLTRADTLAIAGDLNQSIPHHQYYGCKQNEAVLNERLNAHQLTCFTAGTDPHSGTPRIDHICVSTNGFNSHSPPTPGAWPVPCVNGKRVTDHSGVYVDL